MLESSFYLLYTLFPQTLRAVKTSSFDFTMTFSYLWCGSCLFSCLVHSSHSPFHYLSFSSQLLLILCHSHTFLQEAFPSPSCHIQAGLDVPFHVLMTFGTATTIILINSFVLHLFSPLFSLCIRSGNSASFVLCMIVSSWIQQGLAHFCDEYMTFNHFFKCKNRIASN